MKIRIYSQSITYYNSHDFIEINRNTICVFLIALRINVDNNL